jgi:hypothetical protein
MSTDLAGFVPVVSSDQLDDPSWLTERSRR